MRLKGRIGGGGGTAGSVSFETGWTMPSSRSRSRNCGSGACYPDRNLRILVPARVARRQPVYESLQGGPEVGPLSTPRRYRCRRISSRRCPAPSGFADVSPVVTSLLRVKATFLIEPASVSTTPQDTTCLAHSLILAMRYPKGREDARPAAERFSEPAWSTPASRACERVPRFWMHKHMPGGG